MKSMSEGKALKPRKEGVATAAAIRRYQGHGKPDLHLCVGVCINLGATVKVRRSVFFSRKHQNFIVDSMCKCGHLESEHGSLNQTIMPGKRIVRQPGHGNCCADSCPCPRFTWVRHVTVDEKADMVIAARAASMT
jgi:hypothetical protein